MLIIEALKRSESVMSRSEMVVTRLFTAIGQEDPLVRLTSEVSWHCPATCYIILLHEIRRHRSLRFRQETFAVSFIFSSSLRQILLVMHFGFYLWSPEMVFVFKFLFNLFIFADPCRQLELRFPARGEFNAG